MVSHFGECGGRPPPGVYRGTLFDTACMAAPFTGESQAVSLVTWGVVDFPFSVATDTIIFPFDLADYIHRRKSTVKTTVQPNQNTAANSHQPQHEQ
jgi:hypothetical protein